MVPIFRMDVPVSEAKGLLTELVRRAEVGEEVVLTRHGHPVVRLVATGIPAPREELDVQQLCKQVRSKVSRGPAAARSQDFLYDKVGLPK